MKTQQQYQAERKKLAEQLEQLNKALCAEFADILRKNDEAMRIQRELGQKPESLIPMPYFDAVYRILSFAPKSMRLTIIAGTPNEIEALVSRVQTERGFYSDGGHWIEL